LNFAVAAAPSAKPSTPDPANVLTWPEEISRILLFLLSATKTSPLVDTAIPLG